MAKYSKADFAEQCGIKTKDLAVYIGRKKVILSGANNEFIDDKDPVNRIFMDKMQSKMAAVPDGSDIKVEPAPILRIVTGNDHPPVPAPRGKSGSSEKGDNPALRNLELKNQKLEHENELLLSKLEKFHGLVIPTELVKMILLQYHKFIQVSYKEAGEILITDLATLKAMTIEEIAIARGKLVALANQAAQKGTETSKKELEALVKQFSQTRQRGERGKAV